MSKGYSFLFSIILLVMFVSVPALATIINVPGDFAVINYAISDADNGDTVLVAPGTYTQTVDFNGKGITLAGRFILTGEEDDVEATIIDGEDNRRIIHMNDGEDDNTRIIGLTFQNGRANYGGAIYMDNTSPVIQYCKFLGNHATNHGGALKIHRGSALIENSCFIENSCGNYGGAIFLDRGEAIVNNCNFSTNFAGGYGGAIKVNRGILEVNYSDFNCNVADFGGGAIRGCEPDTETSFDHCTFIRNQAGEGGGGGLLFIDTGDHVLNFCTIFGNTADNPAKSAIYTANSADVTLRNSIVWGNGDGSGEIQTIFGDYTVEYCDIEWDSDYPGETNFTDDPLFEDAVFTGDDNNYENSVTYPFTAGQHLDAGNVRVYQEDGDNDIYVEITMADGWTLLQSHVDWGLTYDDIPQNNNGIMVPGQFEYNQDHGNNGVTVHTVRLDNDDTDFTAVIAVHGSTSGPGGQETAWGGNDVNEDVNRWHFYITYDVGADQGGGEPVCETYDIHLTENSPCIDTGDPNEADDPDDTRCDVGRYYWHQDDDGGGNGEPPDPPPGNVVEVPGDYDTIQEAIDNSENGDTIYVHLGTYEENIDFGEHCVIMISQYFYSGDWEDVENTIITGADGSPVITFNGGQTYHCELIGFTITNENEGTGHGGGIYIEDSSPTIESCIIRDITIGGDYYGGGVYLSGSESIFRYCHIYGNTSGMGGGFYATGSSAYFYYCWIYGNTAPMGGAYCLVNCTDFNYVYCLFFDNTAEYGGAFYFTSSVVNFINCTTGENNALVGEDDGFGGAVYIDTNVSIELLNSIFWGNYPQEFFCRIDGEGSRIGANWNVVAGGMIGIINRRAINADQYTVWNFEEDPLWVDSEGFDFHLTIDSPCIDQGHPNSNPDPDGTRCDIGALYFVRENIHSLYFYGAGWFQISMSVLPYIPDVTSVFWDDLTRSYWVFDFEYDRGFEALGDCVPGPGLFFGTEDTLIYLDIIGEEVEDTVRTDLQIPWNMVGMPFLYEIDLVDVLFRHDNQTFTGQQAIDSSWISPIMYCWRHEWFEYREFETFLPWFGYWLACYVDDLEMLIPPTHPGSPSPQPQPGRDEGQPTSWYMNFDAASDTGHARVRLGAEAGASDGYDNEFDYPMPVAPPGGSSLNMYFDREGWNDVVGNRFKQDMRAPYDTLTEKSWDITVEAEAGTEVTVSWGTMEFTTPFHYSFIMIDQTSGAEVNMLDERSYTYQSDGPRVFTVGTQAFHGVEEERYAVPTELALNAIYPNPFNSETVIKYSVPGNKDLNINVYDIAGRQVANLATGMHAAGNYTVSWNALDMSAGVYFVRMQSGQNMSVKKVILVK
ncbi:MAG: T9SS type A sorting domain-containing protein [Calditrichaeota bacterium]|nr:T9SS type A sorting domain-containing protein [Calditrichota bacterium]